MHVSKEVFDQLPPEINALLLHPFQQRLCSVDVSRMFAFGQNAETPDNLNSYFARDVSSFPVVK